MNPLRALAALVLTLSALAGVGHGIGVFWRQPAHEWPMSPTEKLAASGIDGRVMLLRQEIARVSSGDQALSDQIANIALTLRALDAEAEALAKDASESRGSIALVRSTTGPAWVRR